MKDKSFSLIQEKVLKNSPSRDHFQIANNDLAEIGYQGEATHSIGSRESNAPRKMLPTLKDRRFNQEAKVGELSRQVSLAKVMIRDTSLQELSLQDDDDFYVDDSADGEENNETFKRHG